MVKVDIPEWREIAIRGEAFPRIGGYDATPTAYDAALASSAVGQPLPRRWGRERRGTKNDSEGAGADVGASAGECWCRGSFPVQMSPVAVIRRSSTAV